MTLVPPRPDWHDGAACATLTEGEWATAWFPERPDGTDDTDNHGTKAKAVCAMCPVWRECVTGAVERNEEFGIWGGAGGDQLRYLRRVWAMCRLSGDWTAWAEALEVHDRNLADLAVGDRPRVVNRNGAGATDGLRVTYARGSRSWASRFAASANSQGHEPRRAS